MNTLELNFFKLVIVHWRIIATFEREIQIFIRAVYYLGNSIACRTSLEIRAFILPGPGSF